MSRRPSPAPATSSRPCTCRPTSADQIASVQTAIETALPDATVSSQSDLASTVSGSLSSATSLITNLGTWLSIIVLAVAVVLAVLFTISGVSRRTREFGTLKAIGWSNRRVVGQVAGESVAQGLIGGVVGLVLGLAGIWAINLISPTISHGGRFAGRSAPAAGGPGAGGGFADARSPATTDIVPQRAAHALGRGRRGRTGASRADSSPVRSADGAPRA